MLFNGHSWKGLIPSSRVTDFDGEVLRRSPPKILYKFNTNIGPFRLFLRLFVVTCYHWILQFFNSSVIHKCHFYLGPTSSKHKYSRSGVIGGKNVVKIEQSKNTSGHTSGIYTMVQVEGKAHTFSLNFSQIILCQYFRKTTLWEHKSSCASTSASITSF